MSVNRRVVLTGIGVVTSIGLDAASFWDSLARGQTGIKTIQGFDPAPLQTRFAGEIVFRTGKVTPFDDVGCLAIAAVGSALPIHSLWASDYHEPDSLVAVERLVFVRTGTVRTPMGYGIVAVRPGAAADSLARRFGTRPMSWNDVMAWARTEPR